MTSNEKFEIRAIVKFCQHMDNTLSSTFERIKLMKGVNSVSRSFFLMWHERLIYVEDDELTDREER
jgi:hypothetical protein